MTPEIRNLELFVENERLKQELEEFKKKSNVEYQKLWREHQNLLHKINMIADFTTNHQYLVPPH